MATARDLHPAPPSLAAWCNLTTRPSWCHRQSQQPEPALLPIVFMLQHTVVQGFNEEGRPRLQHWSCRLLNISHQNQEWQRTSPTSVNMILLLLFLFLPCCSWTYSAIQWLTIATRVFKRPMLHQKSKSPRNHGVWARRQAERRGELAIVACKPALRR